MEQLARTTGCLPLEVNLVKGLLRQHVSDKMEGQRADSSPGVADATGGRAARDEHHDEKLGEVLDATIASTKRLLEHAQEKILRLNSSHFTGTLDYSYLML